MTTKTDHHAIMELKKAYIPAKRGVVNAAEEKLIREVLELSSRNDIELQNIRDTAVMMYSRWADTLQQANNISAIMMTMDAMSAITYVIDTEKVNRGLLSAPVIKCKKTPRKKCNYVAERREKR